MRFYVDSCIWIDYYENRSDRFRPLGLWAFNFFKRVIESQDIVIISELVFEELIQVGYSDAESKKIIGIISKNQIMHPEITNSQIKESKLISQSLKAPRKDVLHSIIARDNDAVLVTRDKHFLLLSHIVNVKKPEDLI